MSNSYISVSDNETYNTIDEAFKKVFSSNNPQLMKGYFRSSPSFANTELAGHNIWFPKFAKTKSGNFIPATDTALNQISTDEKEIVEILPEETVCEVGDKKITFAKLDSDKPYKFVGIFEVTEKRKGNKISFNKKISDKCLKIGNVAMLFFLLLFASPSLVSCSSEGSDIYGTYEIPSEGRPGYKALTIDSDSIFVFDIVPCDNGFSIANFTAGCDRKDYSKMEPSAAKKDLDTLTMVRKTKNALRITAYEPFENQDRNTKGSFPNGYIISAEGYYASFHDLIDGKTQSVIAQFLVMKHVKDKGRVLILCYNDHARGFSGLFTGGAEVKNKLSHTGKSAEKYVSKILEDYKKTYKEKYKNFVEEAQAYRVEEEEKQNRNKEYSQAVNACGNDVLCSECQGKAFANYGGNEAKKYALDCQNKYKQKLKECESNVDKKFEEEKKSYEKEQRKLKKEWDDGQRGKEMPFLYSETGLRFSTMFHMSNCMETLTGYDKHLSGYYNYEDIVYYLYTEEEATHLGY
jgi:hypothetical protein